MSEAISNALSGLTTKLQAWFESAVKMAPNFVLAILVVVAAGFLARYLAKLVTRALGRISDNDALVSLAAAATKIALISVAVFVALGLLHLERTVTSLLAGLGVVGLALGFAFQDIAANFMSGTMLAIRGPFQTGDIIEVNDQTGVVTEIDLRRTTLRTFDGLTVVIPNKDVFQNTLINYTKTKERRVTVSIGVGYGDDLDKAREVVLETLGTLEGRDESRDVECIFTGFGASSIDFDARFWLPSPEQGPWLQARSNAIIALKTALDDAGLTIPFPIRTLDFGAGVSGGERLDAMNLEIASTRAQSGEFGSQSDTPDSTSANSPAQTPSKAS